MIKLFIDTSVISAYYDDKKPSRMKITQEWVHNQSKNYSLFVSDIVILELEDTPDLDLRNRMVNFVSQNDITILRINQDIRELANKYREVTIKKEINDSLHLATATYFKVDAILSWNFKHIVNLKTIKVIHDINLKNDLPIIEIISINYLGGEYETL